jgi:sugar phosphate isomerase/epimerase
MKDNVYSLGLVSVSFRHHAPKDILEAMKKAGLSLIEWGSDIHAPCDNIENLKTIAELQKEHGILCSSYGTYFRLGETPIDELEKYINAAKILTTNILRLWCGRKKGADMTQQEREVFINDCKKAAKIAEKHEVVLCMECHKKTFTEDPADAVFLMNEVASPHFRMYWQPFQWQGVSDNIKNAQMIAPYAEHIHVFNWKEDKKLPLLEAVSEWREYLKNFSGERTLLLEFMPSGTLDELCAEAQALRIIVGGDI